MVAFAFSINAADDPKSLKELTDKAETIIVGKVGKQHSEWDSNHKMIYTTVTVNVDDYLKGDEKSKIQIIKVPGGKIGDVHLKVIGAPSFDDGEKALLFLSSSPGNGKEKTVIGWNKGKIPLHDKSDAEVISLKKIKKHLAKTNPKSDIPEMIQFPDPDLLVNKAKKYKPTTGNIPESETEIQAGVWGWRCVWGDNFEGDFPGTDWVLSHNLIPEIKNGYTWGKTNINPYDGDYAVWCAQSNFIPENPDLKAGVDNYPPMCQAWMAAGPFDLSDCYTAQLTFKIDQTVEPFRDGGPTDRTGVGFSIDGVWFKITDEPEYQWLYNSTDGYIDYLINIENVIGPLWDKTQVWICFIFWSDHENGDRGIWIDNVKIKKYLPQSMHPEIASVTPAKQSAGTGKSVKIRGLNFGDFNDGNPDTKVEFFSGFYWWGDSMWIEAKEFTYWGNTKIICDVPRGASSGKIRLRRPREGIAYHDFDVSFGYDGCRWQAGVGNASGTDYPIIPFKVNPYTYIDYSAGLILEEMIDCANTWNMDGNAMVHLEFSGMSYVFEPALDGENTVLWDEIEYPPYGIPSITYLWTDGAGTITEADLVLNKYHTWINLEFFGGDPSAAPPSSLITINWATHEFGNFLGLSDLHGANDMEKTMFGFNFAEYMDLIFLDQHAIDLHPEDIEGLQWIYGHGCSVNFAADPAVGVGPMTVQFMNNTKSKYPIASYLWDLGNGETSNEQNPTATYDAENAEGFDVSLTVTDVYGHTNTGTIRDAVKVNVRVAADILAEPTCGYGPLTVQFENKTTGTAEEFLWDFGDGNTSNHKNPIHTYAESGVYSVSLTSSGPGGKHTQSIAGLVEVYDDVEHLGLTYLELVDHSGETWRGEGWDNAVDHDTYHTQGTTNVKGDHPFAVFTFDDGFSRTIEKVRLLTDTGLEGKEGDWVSDFTIAISTDGENYTEVGTFRKAGGGWQDFTFDPVEALFVKLTCEASSHRWQQIGEFEVYEKIVMPDIAGSIIMASESHIANGYDQAGVKIALADANGNPVADLSPSYFRIAATGSKNYYNIVTETDDPGVYLGTFSSLNAEDKNVSVRIGGIRLLSSTLTTSTPVAVKFTEPELTKEELVVHEGSETWRSEGWDKAVDGDPETQVAASKFNGCYGIYKFAGEGERAIIKVRLFRGNGKGYPQQLVTEYKISTSTDGVNFTELFRKYTDATDWEEKLSLPVIAKYIKIELLESQDKYRAFAELEVYTTPLVATSFDGLVVGAFKSTDLIPTKYALRQNYPNPFNPETMISFDLPEQAKVTLQVYNLMGQSIKTLVNERKVAGRYQVAWDGTNDKGLSVASSVYFYRIKAIGETKEFSQKMKMMLIR